MRYILILLFFVYAPSCLSDTITITNVVRTIHGGGSNAFSGQVDFDWQVVAATGGEEEIHCGTPVCYIVLSVIAYPGATQMCPGYWFCNPAGLNGTLIPYVIVPEGSTWASAIDAFWKRNGRGGHRSFGLGTGNNIFNGRFCVGVGAYPTMSSYPIYPPGGCTYVPPADLTCDISLPAELDLGTTTTGYSRVNGSIRGGVNCSSSATVTVAAAGHGWTLDSVPLSMFINGVELTSSTQIIGSGTQVALDISVVAEGEFNNPGIHSAVIPLVIGYY